MKRLPIYFCLLITACSTPKHHRTAYVDEQLNACINAAGEVFAPDKRTTWYKIEAKSGVLTGETSSAAAKTALIQNLSETGLSYTDSIVVLPSAELKETYAVVTISVANIRVQPSHRAELSTQATMGTPLRVWKRERGWHLVQTPDQYFGWVDAEAVQKKDSVSFHHWQQMQKLIYIQPYGFAYENAYTDLTVSDLVYGDVMAIIDATGDHVHVMLPDGRKAFVHRSQSILYNEWRKTRQPLPGSIVAAAKKMMGVPYLWGGTSFKGVDCSGFTKTAFFMNGLVLPRDAYQQAMLGEEINVSGGWESLQPGDLLFFGSPAKGNTPERVAHVGIWIGNKEFIHASGKVQVASLDPSAPNYDAGEHKRFLRAKRISPESSLFDLRYADMY